MSEKKTMNSPGTFGGCVGFAATAAFPHDIGLLPAAIVGAVCVGAGVAMGEATGTFFKCLREPTDPTIELPNKAGLAVGALICGIVGLLFWILPIFGLPVTIAGYLLGKTALPSVQRKTALIGMGLSLLGLLLSVGNAYVGAYMNVLNQLARHRP